MRKSFILLMVMFAIFACTNECLSEFLNECLTESNLENNSGNNQTDIDEPVKKFTTLQQVVNDTNAGEEIDLSEYKDLTDYSATVNKTLTIKNGSLNNAKLQITGENVKLEKIEKVSVSTSSRLTITNSKLSDLLIGGSGETSRSTPSSSEMTLAMVTVTDSEIENVELNGFNSQLNITDKTTKIEDIVISTKAKVILESGSYEGMKAPTVINDGEVARVDMTKKTELSVLSVYSSPQKLEYNIGDKIDLAGLIVMGTYFTDVETFKSGGWKGESSDTITKWEDEKDYTVSYDFNTAGVSIVTVTSTKYPEIKCNFHVFVKELQNSGTSQPEKEEIEITEIELRSFGTPKTLYKVGEKLDLSCYQVVGTYNGFEINLPFTSEPLNGSDLKSSGEITVTFYYDYKPVSTQTITVTESHTVTFKDGEKTLYTLKVAGGELLKLPVVDERTGYTFDGWYKDDGTKIEAGDEVTGNITLYAKWTADTYTIAYNLNGGENNTNNPTSYTVETETITLGDPTKNDTNSTFLGWYNDSGDEITEIAKGSTGNITVTARWSTTCTADNVSSVITSLSGDGPHDIVVQGGITSDTITTIKSALDTLKQNNSTAKVNLNLSETTGLTSIGESAFSYCTNLTSIIIPDGVTLIGESAFSHCSQLTSITFPESVTTIGNNVFDKCSNLTKFIVDERNQYFSTLEDGKILCDENQETLIAYPSASGSITIPDGITTIAGNAFVDCTELTDITIPNSVTSIGNGAFGRTGFTSVELPNSIIEMGTDVFAGCSSLETVTLSNSITSIPRAIFFMCHKLSEIVIPSSVTSIGDIAFSACYALKSIDIPDSVTTIERNAFSDCSSLESVTIGSDVTSIGETAFGGCYLLTTVNYRGTQDQWEQIVIDSTNYELINATKTYNYTGE